ncbi:MAG: ACP S-malonyltransferase [Hyphomicrobiales bacterium]
MGAAFVFPGQGSQFVGMGLALHAAFPVARHVFEEVDAALGQRLSALMFEGPEAELMLTANAQPALMAVSLATMRVLESETGFDLERHASFVAGHSLGEYSALAAAGTLTITDTALLLRVRGSAMQAAVPAGLGSMAALIGLDFADASAVANEAAQGDVCQAANDNGGGQVVISGHTAAVERAIDLAKKKGAKRAILLPVSAPFHCLLMSPAADVMRDALAGVLLIPPKIPVVCNVLARPSSDPDEIRTNLVRQVTGTVRWRESVQWMGAQGIDRFFEIGAGKVLTGLLKRIVPDAEGFPIGGPEDIAFCRTVLGLT